MDALTALRFSIDPSVILEAQKMKPDPWQVEYLQLMNQSVMLLCCRGAGKSRSTAAKALHEAIHNPGSPILLISPSLRQSGELYRYVRDGYRAIGKPLPTIKETETQLEFTNGSRIICLPSKEATIRGYQGVRLLIKDEAARIPDELNRAVTPMIGISQGYEIDLTTPYGQRGYFYRNWKNAQLNKIKISIPWQKCPRYSREFIEQERLQHGDSWIAQEYECSFESLTGLVYPNFESQASALIEGPMIGQRVGGIDWGFRDPFCALWGTYDPHEDMLMIRGERYERECGLPEHAEALPKGYTWDADPSQPTQILEFRRAGFTIRRAFNKIRPGIAAVRSRLERGKLKIIKHKCPNIFEEALVYRYPSEEEIRKGSDPETPYDGDNHAMDALRYLVARIDRGFVLKYLKQKPGYEPPPKAENLEEAAIAIHKVKLNDPMAEHLWEQN